jgi:hypothetical protein
MNYLIAVVVLFAGLSWGDASAQYRAQSPQGDTGDYLRGYQSLSGISGLRGLFDPKRMKMSNSLSMGYYNSGSTSASRGLYMNRLDYQISQKLSATTHLGYQFQPSGPEAWNPATNGNSFVGGADLNYSPSRNSLFRLSVYRNMEPHRGYGPLGWNDYGYSPGYFHP